MSDGYDYYPCNIISIKKDANVNIVKLNVTYDKNLTGTVDYYATKLSSISSNGITISLTTKTKPLYLRIPNKKSKKSQYLY